MSIWTNCHQDYFKFEGRKKKSYFNGENFIRLRDTLEIDPKVFEQNGHRDDEALVDIFEKLGFRQIPERLGLKVQG